MSRETEAFSDLITSFKALKWLSTFTEKGKGGSQKWVLEVIAGPTRFVPQFGCRKKFNGYTLTLISKAQTAPADMAEKLGILDDVLTHDRRRGGSAQSTIASEDGWTPDEDEGREAFSISTTIEIQFNEVK